MNDAVGLVAAAIGLILVPVCLVRLVLGRADLAALYRAPTGDAWPRGVQEGDCPSWRLDEADPGSRRPVGCATTAGEGTAELDTGTGAERATPDPGRRRHPVHTFEQPRVAVRARVGLARRSA